MDQRSQTNADEGATDGDTPASYPPTTFHQPSALESVPPSSAAAAFLTVAASQGAVSYPATVPPQLLNQQPPQATTIEGAAETLAAYALTAYHHQPVPLMSVPPSSAGAAFLPVPASQGSVAYSAPIPPQLFNQQPSQATAIEGAADGDTPAAYSLAAYRHQPAPLVSVPPSSATGTTAFLHAPASQGAAASAYSAAIPPPLSNQHQAAFQKLQQQQQQQLQYQQEQLHAFWVGQLAEAEQATGLKVHSLPLARIKKIMKADEDVKMIAAEAPVVFAKACEMFILELTLRSWLHTEGTRRRTLQRSDVSAAITANEMFDFLVDVAPTEEQGGDGAVPPPQPPAAYGPFAMYANQQPAFMWAPPEYQQQQQQNADDGRDE